MGFANVMRPQTFEQVIGQAQAVKTLSGKFNSSVVLQGPPGSGKTTLGMLYLNKLGLRSQHLDGTKVDTDLLRQLNIEANRVGPIAVLIDEIQYLTKKQQQLLLLALEVGSIVLVATTTEHANSALHEALVSRCMRLQLYPLTPEQISEAIKQALTKTSLSYDVRVIDSLGYEAHGDMRYALNILEVIINNIGENEAITEQMYEDIIGKSVPPFSIEEYKSALQKSIRGSDVDASAYYAHAMCQAGYLEILCRRLRVIVSEDIGLASVTAPSLVGPLIDNALHLGMPEAIYPILHAVTFLALQPKSGSLGALVGKLGEAQDYFYIPPTNVRWAHSRNYVYPLTNKNCWVEQQYLPDKVKDSKFYTPGFNKYEQAYAAYWKEIKGE